MDYQLRHVKLADVQREANTVLAALKSNTALREEARKAGIDLTALDNAFANDTSEQLIQVKQEGIGLDPATTAVIVAFAPVAAKILRDTWDHVILPRIRGMYGPEAIKPVTTTGHK